LIIVEESNVNTSGMVELEGRKAEERRNLPAGCGYMHPAVAHLNFLLGLFKILGILIHGNGNRIVGLSPLAGA
jgi:hypothetical protein